MKLALLILAVSVVGCGRRSHHDGVSDAELAVLAEMAMENEWIQRMDGEVCALDTVVAYPIHLRVPAGVNAAFVDVFDISNDGSRFRVVVRGRCPR